jgi:transketolase
MRRNYRDALGEAFVKIGEEVKNLVIVTADVSKSTRSIKFKEKYPERFLSVGIAEANAIGISAGISSFRLPVIFTAYSVFATEKPFEQIRNMICYPKLNVKIVATHGGINVGEDGVTHQAIEDIAIMRVLPEMKVIVAADPGEVTAALRVAVNTPGPVFLRLGRAETEVIHENENEVDFKIGKAEILRDGKDVTLMAVGMMVWESLKAAQELEKEGISARVVNIRTIKPIDTNVILSAAIETGAIVTSEDHSCIGGLGSAVAEVLVNNYPVPMSQVAIQDTFAESGECCLLLNKYKLTADEIYNKAKYVLNLKLKRGINNVIL